MIPLRTSPSGPVVDSGDGPTGPTGPQGSTGATGPTDGPPTQILWVDPEAADGGDGSEWRPFNDPADAIAAAGAGKSTYTRINVVPGSYGSFGPLPWTDKRLHFVGQSTFNQSGNTVVDGLALRPSNSDPGGGSMILEVERMNVHVQALTDGTIGFARDAYVEAQSDGTHFTVWNCSGGDPDTMRISPLASTNGQLTCFNTGVVGSYNDSLIMTAGKTTGPIFLVNAGTDKSVVEGSLISHSITCAHPMDVWASYFPADGSSIVLSASALRTDLATYARGALAGVTWPALTVIVDVNVRLQPAWVDDGGGVNSAGDVSPAYGTNLTGDLFLAELTCIGSTVPATPVGWSLEDSHNQGVVYKYWYTRDTRSGGGESGSVTWTIGAGNLPNEARIHTFRNVAATGFVESKVHGQATSGGPTVPLGAPTIAAGGAARLAVALTGGNGSSASPGAITGQTGGTWEDKSSFTSGLGAVSDLQTAVLADSGTVSGGTATVSGNAACLLGFALVGAIS